MTELISGRDDLISYLSEGCKTKDKWRIGTEHEKFAFDSKNFTPLPYEGDNGIGNLLGDFQKRHKWDAIYENDNIIALKQPDCRYGGSITLEPGGQVELSGAPLENIHQTCNEVHTHLHQIREVGDDLGIGMLGLGFSPKWSREQTPKMPKGRYKIMTAYMPKVGNLGLDMMYRSCTVQVNLDYSDEADMVKKFRVGLALQPFVTALFANSPFTEGKPNGYQSFRSEIWRDTDPDRTGMLPFVFEDGMSFERYVDYALDVPMYFIQRDNKYIDATGKSFRDFLQGRLDILPGEYPTLTDWSDHLTTIFPEVRLKRFIEMRGADGGCWQQLCGLPALWVGLLYDSASLEAAWALIRNWSYEDLDHLRNEVPRHGLKTSFLRHNISEYLRDILEISSEGLQSRSFLDKSGNDEQQYLRELYEIVNSGWSLSDRLLDSYHNKWQKNIDNIFVEHAY